MNFRQAKGTRPEWLDTRIKENFSNFLFIDQRFYSHPVLRRIFSLARKLNYQSLLIETIQENNCQLLVEENEALARRDPTFKKSDTFRLTFWRCLADQVKNENSFLGYAVFKLDHYSGQPHPYPHVYESVLPSIRNAAENNFIHCRREYEVRTVAGNQPISGVLYAQQNDRTFVCAHVALRTALSCLLPEADISYHKINQLLGIDHRNTKVGEGSGLSPDAMEKVLSGMGIHFEKIVHEPNKGLDLPTEFQRDLYGFIESGDPALLGFELEDPNPGPDGAGRHIVPVIGHTFNEDAWVPDAQRHYFGSALRYFSSESWLSSYMLHDDNFGPYFCLPRNFLKKDNFRLILGIRRQHSEVTSVDAEAVAFNFFTSISKTQPQRGLDWYDRFTIYTRNGLLVLRSQIIEKPNYVKHLGILRDRNGKRLTKEILESLEENLPDLFWMVEASAQDLFTVSRRKFGELLIDCSKPLPKPLNVEPFILARLPGVIWNRSQGKIEQEAVSLEGHTDIYSSL